MIRPVHFTDSFWAEVDDAAALAVSTQLPDRGALTFRFGEGRLGG